MHKDLEQKIEELLTRGVAEVIDRENLKKRLLSGEKLRVKFGIDPTSPDLHLGHTVALRKLKQLQNLGHQIILLIGDYTAMIGDPSGKSATRKMLSEGDIQENLKDYQIQAAKILDMDRVEVRFNSEWYKKFGYAFLIELTSKFTLARIIERDDFKKRLKDDIDISMMELLYPLMQGYDSVELKADVELGGTDQKFNLLMGRKVQKRYSQKEQDVVTVPLLEGLDGVNKMSKSLGNYIGITDKPEAMLGKVMSIPDNLIRKYFRLLTDISEDEIQKDKEEIKNGLANPRDVKLKLAQEIVRIYHGEAAAEKAKEYFVNTFSKKEIPIDIEVVPSSAPNIALIDYMVEARVAKSKSDARRKIEQGGVSLNGEKIADSNFMLDSEAHEGATLKVGKIHFVRIKFE